ncbi:hypothetical protein yc1106_05586 [Curvularia clavata]|uniref:Uncharacterized protein n=1 Tax=Curvularia clavata TaxID=95742 RepID=A0A9Q8Z8C5_CURCL|nr:hypothetical protein yc1106_05586 [Curvularia clavata]
MASMNPGYAVSRSNGSSEAWVALAALARALNITMDALQVALNGAYDILEITSGDPILALQVSLQRLQYHINISALTEIIGRFQYLFGSLINHQSILIPLRPSTIEIEEDSDFDGSPPLPAPISSRRLTTGKLLHRAEAMRSSAMLMESLDEEWVVDMGGEYLDTPTVWLFAGALHRKT